MASNVFAHHVIKSFLPQKRLVRSGELHALALKYEKQFGVPDRESRLRDLVEPLSWQVFAERPLTLYQTMKNLGGLMLTTRATPRFTAYDPRDPEMRIVREKTPINQLDILEWRGKDHMTAQLRQVAQYADFHEQVRRVPTVASLMSPAIGEIALQVGFRRMVTDVEASEPQYIGRLRAFHEAYSAIYGAEEGETVPFEPVAVYMPTRELIRLYGE